jgi:hypothetical protein
VRTLNVRAVDRAVLDGHEALGGPRALIRAPQRGGLSTSPQLTLSAFLSFLSAPIDLLGRRGPSNASSRGGSGAATYQTRRTGSSCSEQVQR